MSEETILTSREVQMASARERLSTTWKQLHELYPLAYPTSRPADSALQLIEDSSPVLNFYFDAFKDKLPKQKDLLTNVISMCEYMPFHANNLSRIFVTHPELIESYAYKYRYFKGRPRDDGDFSYVPELDQYAEGAIDERVRGSRISFSASVEEIKAHMEANQKWAATFSQFVPDGKIVSMIDKKDQPGKPSIVVRRDENSDVSVSLAQGQGKKSMKWNIQITKDGIIYGISHGLHELPGYMFVDFPMTDADDMDETMFVPYNPQTSSDDFGSYNDVYLMQILSEYLEHHKRELVSFAG